MNIIANNVVAKLTVAFVAAAMIFTFATPAKAQTMEDLQAQIAALMAQIAALTGSTDAGAGAAACTFTRALTVGSQGADVNCLQNYLTSTGHFNFSGGSTGYFGAVTQSAVAAWQGANGVAPAAGYFGPISQARYSALVAAMPTTPTTPGTGDSQTPTPTTPVLQGGEGELSVKVTLEADFTADSSRTEEVLEFEVEAIDSDIRVDRVDFTFDVRPWLYFDEVNLLADGVEVASLSGSSAFTQVSGDYRARFGNLNLVIEEDETVIMTLEVKLRSDLANRDGDKVNVSMTDSSIRYVDAAGFSETGGDDASVEITINDVFGNGDISVTIADNSPEKATIVLNEKSRTTGVNVLYFDVEAEESDMEVTDVEVVFDRIGAGANEAGSLRRAQLFVGNTLLSTKSVTSDTVLFTDLDYKISEDDTRTFRVAVEFENGDQVLNSISTPEKLEVVEVTVWAEDGDFVSVNSGDGRTVLVEETHNLVVNGLVSQINSITSVTSNEGKNLTFTFKMDVTAYGATHYFTDVAADAVDFTVEKTGAGTPSAAITSNASKTGNIYRILKGQTREVTVSITVTSANSEFVKATLDSFFYHVESDLSDTEIESVLGAPEFESGNVSIVATP